MKFSVPVTQAAGGDGYGKAVSDIFGQVKTDTIDDFWEAGELIKGRNPNLAFRDPIGQASMETVKSVTPEIPEITTEEILDPLRTDPIDTSLFPAKTTEQALADSELFSVQQATGKLKPISDYEIGTGQLDFSKSLTPTPPRS